MKFFFFVVGSIPKTIGVAIPIKATFFITYVMVDGWAGIAGEILMLKPLIIYHLKNTFLVKTDKDREEAMDPKSIGFNTGEPRIQLYILLGLVYSTVTPVLLPFIIIFFGLAYVVFRHQVKSLYLYRYLTLEGLCIDIHTFAPSCQLIFYIMFSWIQQFFNMGKLFSPNADHKCLQPGI